MTDTTTYDGLAMRGMVVVIMDVAGGFREWDGGQRGFWLRKLIGGG